MGTASAEFIRDANRAVARQTTDADRERLTALHGELASKQFLGTISTTEDLQLQLVRWQLDRIEDAMTGEALDVFEKAVEQQEDLARTIDELVSRLEQGPSPRYGPRRR